MFDHRLALQHVLVFSLLGSLFVAAPGAAQDPSAASVPLRLVHGGNFLPQGTAVVVLAEQGEAEPGASLQPRFLALDAYPRQTASVLRQDTLDARGITRTRYPITKDAGVRYFIYARTPQERMYWSYSAQKDSIKYDIVNRGVMAVAPIREAAAREEVVQTFFEGMTPVALASAEADTLAPPNTAAEDSMGSELTPPTTERAGVLIPSWAFFLLAPFTLACLGGLLFLTLHYRTRLALRPDDENDLPHFNAAGTHPDRHSQLEKELAEVKTNYERLQKTYNVLLDRHKTLIREMQPGTERAPQETPEVSP